MSKTRKKNMKKMHKNNKEKSKQLVYYYNIICWHVTPAQGGFQVLHLAQG